MCAAALDPVRAASAACAGDAGDFGQCCPCALLPTSVGAAPAPSGSAHESEDQEQHHSTDGRVDDCGDQSDTEMDPKLRQQPVADEGADDTDHDIADQTEAVARMIWPASQPAMRPTIR